MEPLTIAIWVSYIEISITEIADTLESHIIHSSVTDPYDQHIHHPITINSSKMRSATSAQPTIQFPMHIFKQFLPILDRHNKKLACIEHITKV